MVVIPNEDYEAFFAPMFNGKLFDCESMTPEYWEGNNFIQHRTPLKLRIDEGRKPCINILMTGMVGKRVGGERCVRCRLRVRVTEPARRHGTSTTPVS